MNKLHTIIAIALGAMIGHFIIVPAIKSLESEPEPDCAEMSRDLWAFEQCLKYQPACQMEKGIEAFAKYHDDRDTFELECAADRGDTFLSQ